MTIADRARTGWNRFFFEGFSGPSLGLLRLYFGIGLVLFHVTQFESLVRLDPTGAHFVFLHPIWYFDLLGIDVHVPILSFLGFALLMGATVTMALGKWTRSSIVIVLAMIFYLKGVRDSFTGDMHHRYLVPAHMLFLLLLSRCGDVHSRDARTRPAPPLAEWEASWPIKAMQVYCASFYLWSLIAKLRVSGWAWFEGGARLQEVLLKRSVMWGLTESGDVLGNPLAFHLAQMPELLYVLALGTFLLEGGFPLILLVRDPRWRVAFLAVVTVFHLVNFALLYVGFILLPIVFLIFFDLVPVHARLQRLMPGGVGRGPP